MVEKKIKYNILSRSMKDLSMDEATLYVESYLKERVRLANNQLQIKTGELTWAKLRPWLDGWYDVGNYKGIRKTFSEYFDSKKCFQYQLALHEIYQRAKLPNLKWNYSCFCYEEALAFTQHFAIINRTDFCNRAKKLYEKSIAEDWLANLAKDTPFAGLYVDRYGFDHRSSFELYSANYMYECGMVPEKDIIFDRKYPFDKKYNSNKKLLEYDIEFVSSKYKLERRQLFEVVGLNEKSIYSTKEDKKFRNPKKYLRKLKIKSIELPKNHLIDVHLIWCVDEETGKALDVKEYLKNMKLVVDPIVEKMGFKPRFLSNSLVSRCKKNYPRGIGMQKSAIDFLLKRLKIKGRPDGLLQELINRVNKGKQIKEVSEELEIDQSHFDFISCVHGKR